MLDDRWDERLWGCRYKFHQKTGPQMMEVLQLEQKTKRKPVVVPWLSFGWSDEWIKYSRLNTTSTIQNELPGGSWNMLLTAKILHQLMLVLYPIISRVWYSTSQVVPDFWTINSMEDLQSLSEEARKTFIPKNIYIFQSESFKKHTCYLFSIQPFRRHFLVFDKNGESLDHLIIHFGGPWPPFLASGQSHALIAAP